MYCIFRFAVLNVALEILKLAVEASNQNITLKKVGPFQVILLNVKKCIWLPEVYLKKFGTPGSLWNSVIPGICSVSCATTTG